MSHSFLFKYNNSWELRDKKHFFVIIILSCFNSIENSNELKKKNEILIWQEKKKGVIIIGLRTVLRDEGPQTVGPLNIPWNHYSCIIMKCVG